MSMDAGEIPSSPPPPPPPPAEVPAPPEPVAAKEEPKDERPAEYQGESTFEGVKPQNALALDGTATSGDDPFADVPKLSLGQVRQLNAQPARSVEAQVEVAEVSGAGAALDTKATRQPPIKIEPGKSKEYDGMYIGSDGYAYPADQYDPSEVPPFKPNNPPVPQPAPTQYYVNGILTQPAEATFNDPNSNQADGEAQKLANATGTNVVLIYNATEGFNADAAQTFADANDFGDDPAYKTLARAITKDVTEGREVRVTGYSQGGAIVSHALHEVSRQVYEATGGIPGHLPVIGEDNRRKYDDMMKLIHVTTFGGAGFNFPDGPSYDHYVNSQDPVPTLIGGVGGVAGLFAHPGRDARIHTFTDDGLPGANLFSADGPHGLKQYIGAYNVEHTWPTTLANAPADVRNILGKANLSRARDLIVHLELSPEQIYSLARTNPRLFTQLEGNNNFVQGFTKMAQQFGATGEHALELIQAVSAGSKDPQNAFEILTNNIERLEPKPTTREEWLNYLSTQANLPRSPDFYRKVFANAHAYLSARVPSSGT